ncbi:MAG: metallophosphoesterase, partial [Gemmatimonadota bacterium]
MKANTSCSETRGGHRGRLGIAAIAILTSVGPWAPPGAVRPSAGGAEPSFEGEYGLFVRHVEGGLDIRWLTEPSAPGVLRAYVDDELVESVETPASASHAATIEVGRGTVRLEYGALGDPDRLHETRIWTEPVRRDPLPAYRASDSVFVVGDVHGQYDTLVRLLHHAGLIDAEGRWSGGRQRLVFLGDLFDRGADVTRLLWFLYRLEHEAAEAGGRLHLVLGNHELMVMASDLRYVDGKEWMVAFRHGLEYSEMFDPRHTVLGRWLASKPLLLRLDDLLLAHGGVSPAYVRWTLRDVQDS